MRNQEDLENMLDQDIEESIQRYIKHIRYMAMLTDDQLTMVLREKALQDPGTFEALKEGAMKKALVDIKKAAKDIKGDPVKFARRVDDFT